MTADDDTPHDLFEMVASILGSGEKAFEWFEAVNPMLGGVSALNMLRLGREERLRRFIEAAHEAAQSNKTESIS